MYDAVRDDLVGTAPKLLIVLRPARDLPKNGLRRLHYIRYFERQPELAALFAGYQFLAAEGEFDVYERLPAGATRTRAPPSDAPGTLDVRRGALGDVRLAVADPAFAIGAAVFAALLGLTLVSERRRRAVSAGHASSRG